jgi:mannopine transport system permease protein
MRARSPLDNPLATLALTGVAVLILLFLILPTVLVIPLSFSGEKYLAFPPKSWSLQWYAAFFTDPDWQEAIGFSLKIAVISTLITTAIGTVTALILVRGNFIGRGVIKSLVLAPMIVPHIILAVALYLAFSHWGLTGSLTGLVIAHVVLCVPFVVLTVSAALQRLDPSLEMAALSLGASPVLAFTFVTLPLLRPAILTGAVFAFITSLDEAVVSYFLSGTAGKTLTRKMFEDIDFDVSPVIAAVSTLILFASVGLMALVQAGRALHERKKLNRTA